MVFQVKRIEDDFSWKMYLSLGRRKYQRSAEESRIGGFTICVRGLQYHWVGLTKKADVGWTCVLHGGNLYQVFVLKASKEGFV
jgi:hypothetical protein